VEVSSSVHHCVQGSGVEAPSLAPDTPPAVLHVGSDSQLGKTCDGTPIDGPARLAMRDESREGHRCQGPPLGLLHIDLGDDEDVGDFVPIHHGSELKR
jgi:hypothetical protein